MSKSSSNGRRIRTRKTGRRTTPLWIEHLESRSLLAAVPAPGLVSWYRAEDNVIDSAYGHNGTLVNGTTFAAGKVGQALSFDGLDDEVRVPHVAGHNPGNQITIEAWVRPNSSGHGRPIMQKRSPSNVGGFSFETTHSSIAGEPANGLQFVIWRGDFATITTLRTPADSLIIGQWQHVAATYDGGVMRIFVNGVEVATRDDLAGFLAPTTEPLVIGRNVVIPSFGWDGLIDEPSLYNRALSAAEIQAIVVADSEGKDSEAVVYRADFDDSQTTVYRTDFEQPVGSEWSSGLTDVTPIGNRRFLGQFGSDTVTLTIPAAQFPQGTDAVRVSLDLFVLRTWDGNHDVSGSGPDRWSLTLGSGVALLDTTFSNGHPNSEFAGQAYPGVFGAGQSASRTGADENNTLGYEFGEPMDSVYDLDFTFSYTGGDLVLHFAGLLTTPGPDESWGLDNVVVQALTSADSAPNDFSSDTNPHDPWSYGWTASLGSELQLYADNATLPNGAQLWAADISQATQLPTVVYNPTGGTLFTENGYPLLPGQLGFHPGPNGEYSVVRWTAPADDTIDVAALFTGRDMAPTSTDAHVLHNGVPLFAGAVNRFRVGPYFAAALTVQAGDTVDFAIGNGGNGYLFDSSALDAVITRADQPSSGISGQFAGTATKEPVQGYAVHGFSGNLLRNDSQPAERTTLTLEGLPEHDSIDLRFLLAIIDSWDGSQQAGQSFAPDVFNVSVDGNLIFSETFVNSSSAGNTQSYVAPLGVELGRFQQLGFNQSGFDYLDSAYNLALDPAFQNIPHTASTLTVEWFAGGSGYEGSVNESWAIDNVEVVIDKAEVVPPPTVQLAAARYEVTEGQAVAVLTVERSGDLRGTSSIDFQTASGTATQRGIRAGTLRVDDFTSTSGTLLFKSGVRTREIRVPIRNDVAVEPDELFRVILSNPSVGTDLGAIDTAEVVIHDNDPTVQFVAATSQRSESSTSRNPIGVKLLAASAQTVTVAYSVVAGTATQGADYRRLAGTLTFQPGQTSKTLNLVLINDSQFEGTETLTLELKSPTNGFLGNISQHTVTIIDNDPEPPPPEPGSTPDTARFIDLQTLPRQSFKDLVASVDRDTFRVSLKAGERLALDVDPRAIQSGGQVIIPGLAAGTLVIIAPDKTTELARIGPSVEPDTGVQNNNPATMFQATDAGDYYIQLRTATGVGGYWLNFHRIGVSENVPSPERLNIAGNMFAWFDGSDTVGITGPSGYGFTLSGPWQQQTLVSSKSRLTAQTLRLAAGSQFTLKSPQGVEVPLLANGPISITTKAQRWGNVIGVVNTPAIKFPVSLAIAPINDLLAETFGSQFLAFGLLSGNWRISLGGSVLAGSKGDVTSRIGALLDGVPYLRQKGPIKVTAQLGSYSLNYSVIEKPIDWAFDPGDPMLYLKAEELGQAKQPALAISLHGLLEFLPQDAPSPLIDAGITHFFGHVYATATIPFKVGPLPLEVDAEVVVNVDANRDGRVLGDLRDVDELFDILEGDFSEIGEILRDVQVGANGKLTAVFEDYDFDTELGRASVVLNGLEESIWVRGQQGGSNPLAGTPLAQLNQSSTIVLEGMIDWDGDFLFSTTTTYDLGPAELVWNITISDQGIFAKVTGRAEWSAQINYGLGTVSGKAIAAITASVEITIDDDGKPSFSGSITSSGKLRYQGENLFSGSIESSIRKRGFRFRFPRGVGTIELPLIN